MALEKIWQILESAVCLFGAPNDLNLETRRHSREIKRSHNDAYVLQVFYILVQGLDFSTCKDIAFSFFKYYVNVPLISPHNLWL